jgi:uncharacterized protein YuzB (UPF0349 family)
MGNVTGKAVVQLRQSNCTTNPAMCLDHCGICCSSPFLVVDGALQKGDSHHSLLAEIEHINGDEV